VLIDRRGLRVHTKRCQYAVQTRLHCNELWDSIGSKYKNSLMNSTA